MTYKSTILKTKLLPLIFFLVSAFVFGQNKQIEQVKNHLKTKNPNDSTKVKAYYTLAQQYTSFNKDSLSFYTNKALELSLKTNNYLLARIYNYKGIEFLMNSKPDSARIYLNKALNILEKEEDIETKAVVYQNFSNSYSDTGQFEKKIEYIIKSIDLLENNPYNQCTSIFNLAAVYAQSGMLDKALENFKRALEISIKGKNIRMENASYMAIGTQYVHMKKLDSAKVALEKSLEICKKTNATDSYFRTYSKVGGLYDKMKLYSKSEKARIQAKKYAEKLGVESNIMESIGSLAGHYLTTKKYKKSSKLYKEFDSLYKKNPRLNLGLVSYRNWAEVEGHLGNIKKSSELLDKFLSIKDSIYSKENRAIISEVDTKYQTEKKDKEIAQQNLLLEQQETELQKKKKENGYITGAALVLLISSISLWFLYQQRQKRKNQEILTLKREQQVQTLESLIEGEEKERMRIAKELHDGVNVDLSAIKYKLTSLLEKNNQVINEAVTMIDKSCEQVRAISHNLIPPSLKNFSLIESLEDFCTTSNGVHKPQITFNHIGETVHIAKKAEVNIFRIVQELVNNSIKHAKASEIAVQISHRDNAIQLTIEDNGEGFDKEKSTGNGIGLQNVQSRIDYLNAKLDFHSTEKGASYIIDINTDSLA